MGIRVSPGTIDTMGDYRDGFVVHVRHADDTDAAANALALARLDIIGLSDRRAEAGPVVSSPVMAPDGPLLRVARLEVDDDTLGRIPDLIVGRLKEAGVRDAVVTAPEPGGKLDKLDSCPNAVVLRLFPEPAGANGLIPARWIDIVCEWVLGDLLPNDSVPMRLLAIEFDVPVPDAPAVVHQASLARAWCDVVNGNPAEKLRTASLTFGGTPHVALAAGGPACDSSALLARYELLCELARELADETTYSCVDMETTFEYVGLGFGSLGWRDRGGASPNLVAGTLCDMRIPDVFPFQVLGPGHRERFEEAGRDLDAIGEPVTEDKVAVTVGEPEDWLPIYDARDEVQAEGFEALAPLLATDAEVDELLARHPDRSGESEVEQPGGIVGMPDLGDIRLETLPHARRGLRLTFLELVSWLAHEPHSDAPQGVSPVLATYSRWFASALDDQRRQELKSRARSLIGTGRTPRPGTGGRLPLTPTDSDRAWLTTDWLIRVQAAGWLRAAGLVEAAGRLESIGPTSNHLDLVRAVDILSTAIVIASRRIELTASMAGTERAEDAVIAEQAAWEAWERASESSGWVAASEAAAVGIPAELAYATDLRVIECSRDGRLRDELEEAGRTVGDAAWSTALHSVADEAWTAGWDAAHPAVDAVAVLSLHTALDRATRAAVSQSELDEDASEIALETAEAAAKERLTRAALGSSSWNATDHPWDSAFNAAAEAEGGELWAKVQHLARRAVDEVAWEAGMAAARAAVDEVLADAPSLVARGVGAAVAREAAGVAARGIALRAAVVALAQGEGQVAAVEAASAALAPTARELQDAAFALLDVLISAGRSESDDDRHRQTG